MKYDYNTLELAKKVRARAAETIKNESQVIQNDERKVSEATDVINLCNIVIGSQESQRSSGGYESVGICER